MPDGLNIEMFIRCLEQAANSEYHSEAWFDCAEIALQNRFYSEDQIYTGEFEEEDVQEPASDFDRYPGDDSQGQFGFGGYL